MTDSPQPSPHLSLQNKRILLGLSGGIAAYKAAELCRLLKGAGADVIGAACIVDRSNGKADVGGLKFVSLAAVDFPDYDANDLPPALAKLPATKPGSRGLK